MLLFFMYVLPRFLLSRFKNTSRLIIQLVTGFLLLIFAWFNDAQTGNLTLTLLIILMAGVYSLKNVQAARLLVTGDMGEGKLRNKEKAVLSSAFYVRQAVPAIVSGL